MSCRWVGRRSTGGLNVLNQGVQMASHKNKKPVTTGGQGTWGVPSTSASNLSIILWILGYVSQSVSHAGLPLGVTGSQPAYRWGNQRGDKKNPRQQGILSRVLVAGGKLGVPVGDIWVYPRGLTIPLYCRGEHSSIPLQNIFFFLKIHVDVDRTNRRYT